ncbi:uncharacterized protein BCR38DRAFT_488887 [Pseudomassariella vexata]|uniref:Uncharacterized protein n=1 Tax=Pseudomassariella vexata TaxID=1141098 RepID=A0A1Y2DIU9_9PEZI|nr:uncharacterized protein BCR38DRAFT_488887 [Pseudomassariella vexata]ORY59151.1 hypothetical protein BCR38DRAFT_488887 [Pseudomassariella vexata]
MGKRQATFYEVSKFDADCIPHSTYCAYNFTVVPESSMFPTLCTAFLQGPDYLPAVTNGTCDNIAYTWTVNKLAEGGLNLTIKTPFNARLDLTGVHAIAADEIELENNGAVRTQHYIGAANFTVPITGTPSS